jgi:protein ImuA
MASALLNDLTRRIGEIEASERPCAAAAIPLASSPLAEVFPDKSLPVGCVMELLAATEGAGTWTLALLLAKLACGERKLLIVADGQERFFPPAAFRLGIDLHRVLFLRTPQPRNALAALVQSLRCPAVGCVIGNFERLTSVECRRLQLAAERGGGVGLILRPLAALRSPSFAAARFLVRPVSSLASRRRVQIEVIRARGGKAGRSFLLEIDHETGHVCLPSPLAAPATAACSSGNER